jgi:hypothetical protein
LRYTLSIDAKLLGKKLCQHLAVNAANQHHGAEVIHLP